jgi:hypothetical protein
MPVVRGRQAIFHNTSNNENDYLSNNCNDDSGIIRRVHRGKPIPAAPRAQQ